MSSLIRPKQIFKILTGPVRVNAFSFDTNPKDVTAVTATVLTTAGIGSTAVTQQVSGDELTPGIIATASNNRIEVYTSSTKRKINYLGNEVYGRITKPAAVYLLTLYYLNAGTETIYTLPGTIVIDFEFSYRYKFKDLPADFALTLSLRNVNNDSGVGTAGRVVKELLTVTAPDTVTNLSFTPDITANVTLFVNGKEETQVGGTPPFGTSGQAITWDPSAAGYNLATTDRVVAEYTTLQ